MRRQDGNLHLSLNFTRAKYWLSQGAEPTPTVSHLLRRVGLMPDPRSPDRVSLAPVSPVHADAAGGMGSYAKGGASEFLEETTSQERAAAAWDVARKQGTFKLQQMRRDAERGARRANEDEKVRPVFRLPAGPLDIATGVRLAGMVKMESSQPSLFIGRAQLAGAAGMFTGNVRAGSR